jgi:hypothetical protein
MKKGEKTKKRNVYFKWSKAKVKEQTCSKRGKNKFEDYEIT